MPVAAARLVRKFAKKVESSQANEWFSQRRSVSHPICLLIPDCLATSKAAGTFERPFLPLPKR